MWTTQTLDLSSMELARATWKIVSIHNGGSHVLFLDHPSHNSQSWHTLRQGIVLSQTVSIGPSHSGGGRFNSRPSPSDRSCIPRYVSNDEFLDAMVDDVCQEYETSASMSTDMQNTFLESSIATTYESVGGAGPSREFEEPQVDLTFDLTQPWPSYIGPETIQTKHFEQPSVDLPSCTTTPEVTTCPDTAPMALIPESVLDHIHMIQWHHHLVPRSQQTNEDLEDEDRSQ
eukprot:Gb_09462 [translate_table: standard]